MTRRYVALSLVSLTLLTAGILALAVPSPYQGPLLVPVPANTPLAGPASVFGLSLLQQPVFLADLVGLALLAAAVLEIWVMALAWELLRRRQAERLPRPKPRRQ
jgi:hypothetical protein